MNYRLFVALGAPLLCVLGYFLELKLSLSLSQVVPALAIAALASAGIYILEPKVRGIRSRSLPDVLIWVAGLCISVTAVPFVWQEKPWGWPVLMFTIVMLSVYTRFKSSEGPQRMFRRRRNTTIPDPS